MQRFGGVRTRAYLLSRYGPEPGCAIRLVGRERFRALGDNLGYSFGEEPTKQGRKGRSGRRTAESLKQNCERTVGGASVAAAPGAPSMVRFQAGPAGRLLIGIFTRLLLEPIREDVERPLALVFVKGGRRPWMRFWLHARGGYSSYAIGSLQQIGYDSGLAGGIGLIFLASLSLCSRCCCWSWLSVRPSFSA
jgi:hypothetical protein